MCDAENQIRLELDAAAVEYNGYIYFAESGINGLFRLNIVTGITEFLCFFEKEEKVDALFRNAYLFYHTAWFIPWRAKHIVCVDLDTLTMDYFDIPCGKANKVGEKIYPFTVYLTSGRINEKEIFLVPMSNDTPAVIDMERAEIKAYPGMIDAEHEVMGYGTSADGMIWMVPYIGNRILIFDYKTGNINEISWKYKEAEYSGILYYHGEIWFAPCRADNILKYNIHQRKFTKIPLGVAYQNGYTYAELKDYDDKIWVLPKASNRIIFYDLKTKRIEYINKKPEICFSYPTDMKYIESKTSFMLATCRTGCLSIYQNSKKDFTNIKAVIDRNELYERIKQKYFSTDQFSSLLFLKGQIILENYLGLENYLKYVDAADVSLNIEKEKNSSIGAAIYNITKTN